MVSKLKAALDRLAIEIDPGDHEAKRYLREEGAALDRAVSGAIASFNGEDFTAVDLKTLGQDGDGFIINHDSSGYVVGYMRMKVDRTILSVWFDPVNHFSMFKAGQPTQIPIEEITKESVDDAVADQFMRVNFKGHP